MDNYQPWFRPYWVNCASPRHDQSILSLSCSSHQLRWLSCTVLFALCSKEKKHFSAKYYSFNLKWKSGIITLSVVYLLFSLAIWNTCRSDSTYVVCPSLSNSTQSSVSRCSTSMTAGVPNLHVHGHNEYALVDEWMIITIFVCINHTYLNNSILIHAFYVFLLRNKDC